MNSSIKTLLIGDINVGKTFLFQRLTSLEEPYETGTTTSLINEIKAIDINENENILFEFYDTPGSKKYREIIKFYLTDTKLIIFIFDITNKKSLIEIYNFYYKFIFSILKRSKIIIGLVGNKIDLSIKRKISKEKEIELSEELNANFLIEISTKENLNINKLIDKCIKSIKDLDENINGIFKKEYNNGNIYDGNFIKGKKNGFGKMFFKSGNIYEGNCENDIQNGKGIVYYKNGDIYNGFFKNGEINGNGIYKWKNGEIFEGDCNKKIILEKGLKFNENIFNSKQGAKIINPVEKSLIR